MSDASFVPQDRRYTKDHEWVRIEGDTAIVGITDHAQKAMGDITYVELPPVGKSVRQFKELAVVESAKAASDIFAPVSGTVSEVNAVLESAPETVNKSPYEKGWVCKLTGVKSAELDDVLSPAQYEAFLEQEAE